MINDKLIYYFMKQIFFFLISCHILSFHSFGQLNMFDDNGLKHGEWIEDEVNFKYYHGKPIGKVIESNGYVIYDSIGEIIQRIKFFQERPTAIMSEEYVEFGKTKLMKRFRINPSTKQVYLISQESFKITKNPNGYVNRTFDGLQVSIGGNASIYPTGLRIEEIYENGNLIKKGIFYPDGINKLDELEFIATGIKDYPYVQSQYTIYYKNGQKLIQFDPRYFFSKLIDKGQLNGNLKYEGNNAAALLNLIDYYCPEMKDFEFSGVAGNSFQYSFSTYRENINFFSNDSISIPIFAQNGAVIKSLTYAKTRLHNDYNPNNYALPSTKCKIDTADYFQYQLHGTYKNKYNRLEKYFFGMEDSIIVFPYGQTTIYLLFDKGKLLQIENYHGSIVEQASYNNRGVIHGSHKKYDLQEKTVEEVIYEDGKKISAPPKRQESFVSRLRK